MATGAVAWAESDAEADALPADTLVIVVEPLAGPLTVSPSGIPSVEQFGTPVVSIAGGPLTIAPPGISTAEVFGSPTVSVTGSFDPLTQVTPLQAVWASDPLWTPPADGVEVDSMRNASGGGNPAATLTVRPLYRASVAALGNRPAVQFDGVNDTLVFNVTDAAQTYKVLVVGKFVTATVSTNIFGGGASSGTGIGVGSTGFFYAASSTVLNSTTAPDTAPHSWLAVFAGASSSIKVDGAAAVTGDAGTAALSYFRLGAGGSTTTAARWASCYVCFAGIYSGATLDADLITLAADLRSYYGF